MEYEMKNGILVPKATPSPIYIFFDETYLLDQTGFLQSGIPVPQNIYTGELVPHCQSLLQQLGQDAKEFKGSAIKAGNANIYRDFLKAFINVTAHVADRANLFPIVAVDATGVYAGHNYNWIYNNVVGGLANMGINDEDQLVAEFSRQMLWLYIHYKKVAPGEFANDLILCFDNKHRYAQRVQALRAFTNDRLIAPTFWQLEKAFRSFANTLFEYMDPQIAISHIERFHFQWSSVEFGLQAADLFCNLVYNGIKHEMGIVDDKTSLKAQILKEVMPDFAIDAELQSSLAVAKDHQGRDDIRCVDTNLRSTFQFLPV